MNSDEKKLAETEKLQKVILGELGKVRSKSVSVCRSPESSIGSQMKPVEGLEACTQGQLHSICLAVNNPLRLHIKFSASKEEQTDHPH